MTELKPFVFPALYVRNYDADTITFALDMGFGISRNRQSVRVLGIDTPEKRPKKAGRTDASRAREKDRAKAATARAKTLLTGSSGILVESKELDKYGRVLGVVWLEDEDEEGEPTYTSLGDVLMREGHAVPYDGGTKTKDWGEP